MMHFEVSVGWGGQSLPLLWGIFQDLQDHCGMQAGAMCVSLPLGQCCKKEAEDQACSQNQTGRQWLLQKQKDTGFWTQTTASFSLKSQTLQKDQADQ